MKENCCRNCQHFREEVVKNKYHTCVSYHCELHNLHNNEVSRPDEQFCGSEYFLSIKKKKRLEKLEYLGI